MPDIYDIAEQHRQQLLAQDRAASLAMVKAYLQVKQRLQADLDYYAAKIAASPDATSPAEQKRLRSAFFQDQRIQALLSQVDLEIGRYAQIVGGTTAIQQSEAVAMAQAHAQESLTAAMGPPPTPGAVITFAKLDREALTDLVGFTGTGSPLTTLLSGLGPTAAADFRAIAVGMVGAGKPLQKVAKEVQATLGTPLARALTIVRTETLRSYRTANHRTFVANQDVVKGWVWHASLGRGTCSSCWALHGSFHPLTELMTDHPRGRCIQVPITRTWSELGFETDIPETQAKITPGPEVFAKLPLAQKLAIVGPKRLALLQSGDLELPDLVAKVPDKAWGPMHREASIVQALAGTYRPPITYTVPDVVPYTPLTIVKSELAQKAAQNEAAQKAIAAGQAEAKAYQKINSAVQSAKIQAKKAGNTEAALLKFEQKLQALGEDAATHPKAALLVQNNLLKVQELLAPIQAKAVEAQLVGAVRGTAADIKAATIAVGNTSEALAQQVIQLHKLGQTPGLPEAQLAYFQAQLAKVQKLHTRAVTLETAKDEQAEYQKTNSKVQALKAKSKKAGDSVASLQQFILDTLGLKDNVIGPKTHALLDKNIAAANAKLHHAEEVLAEAKLAAQGQEAIANIKALADGTLQTLGTIQNALQQSKGLYGPKVDAILEAEIAKAQQRVVKAQEAAAAAAAAPAPIAGASKTYQQVNSAVQSAKVKWKKSGNGDTYLEKLEELKGQTSDPKALALIQKNLDTLIGAEKVAPPKPAGPTAVAKGMVVDFDYYGEAGSGEVLKVETTPNGTLYTVKGGQLGIISLLEHQVLGATPKPPTVTPAAMSQMLPGVKGTVNGVPVEIVTMEGKPDGTFTVHVKNLPNDQGLPVGHESEWFAEDFTMDSPPFKVGDKVQSTGTGHQKVTITKINPDGTYGVVSDDGFTIDNVQHGFLEPVGGVQPTSSTAATAPPPAGGFKPGDIVQDSMGATGTVKKVNQDGTVVLSEEGVASDVVMFANELEMVTPAPAPKVYQGADDFAVGDTIVVNGKGDKGIITSVEDPQFLKAAKQPSGTIVEYLKDEVLLFNAPDPDALQPPPPPSTATVPVQTAQPTQPPFTQAELVKQNVHLEGAHEKAVYRDAQGRDWLFKPDETSALAEQAGYQVLHLLGEQAPEMYVGTIKGRVGSIQRMWGDVAGKVRLDSLDGLTAAQRAHIQQHQVIDWLISQHDTNDGAMLLSSSGTVYAVDKGQAFKFLGKDRLDWKYKPNPNPLVYNRLFEDAIAGKYDLDRSAIQAMVAKVEAMDPAALRAAITPYAQHAAAQGFVPSAESVITQVLQRKASIRQDFDALYDRLDQALGREVAKARPTAAAAAPNDVVTPINAQLADNIERMGGMGRAIHVGGRLIEDGQILAYQLDAAGRQKRQLVLDLKLRAIGDAIITDQMGSASRGPAPLPDDAVWDTILGPLKHINAHLKPGSPQFDGTLTASKVANLGSAAQQLLEVAGSNPDASHQGMVERYREIIKHLTGRDLPAVAAATQAELAQWAKDVYSEPPTLFERYIAPAEQPKAGTIDAVHEPYYVSGRKAADGRINAGTGKSVYKDRNGALIASDSYTIDLGDGYTAQYVTHAGGAQSVDDRREGNNGYAHQGRLILRSDWDGSAEGIQRALAKLEALHVPVQLATQQDMELLYLVKAASSARITDQEEYRALERQVGATTTVEDAIALHRQFWNDRLGVADVTKLPDYDPSPHYDTVYIGANDGNAVGHGGWAWWNRFDVTQADLDREMPDYHLRHDVTDDRLKDNRITLGDWIVERIDDNFRMVNTTDRYRMGIFNAAQGSSAGPDQWTGGSSYAFTRIVRGTPGNLVFDKRLLRQTDLISYDHDNYGRSSPEHVRRSAGQIMGWKDNASRGGNETLVKNGFSMWDYLVKVNVSRPGDRVKVLEAFRRHKITHINGRRVEDIVG